MKKLLLLIALFYTTSLFAQTERETLEWLNIKRLSIALAGSSSNTMSYADALEMDDTYIHMTNKAGAWSKASWETIKEIKLSGSYDIHITFGITYEKKPLYMVLRIYDTETKNKYMKALKHMATLNSAKLINDNLF